MATFLALMEGLIGDPAEKAAYAADPDNYLSSRGYGDLDPEDVRTALEQTADALPPRLAAVIEPEAGLAPVAGADLGQLGLSGFDDYAQPLEDDVAGVDAVAGDGPAAHAPDGDAAPQRALDRDVDIDLDGDGVPGAPAPALAVDEPAAALRPAAEDTADGVEGGTAEPPSGGDELTAPALATTTDPFNDPWASPGPELEEAAPWTAPEPADDDAGAPDAPQEDLLDESPWTSLGPVDGDHLGEF